MAAGRADDLDGLIRRVDPDRWLASRFIAGARSRNDVIALYAFDYELGRARRVAASPLMAEIRLTWWREALDEMFAGQPVRRHPTAQALAALVARRHLPRAPLEAMIDAHVETLEHAALDVAQAERWADGVEGSLATLAALTLDPASPAEAVGAAGRAWGLALTLRSGLATREVVDRPLRRALASARVDARALSSAALPAALPARLARYDLAGQRPSPFRKRLSLIAAVAMGRL